MLFISRADVGIEFSYCLSDRLGPSGWSRVRQGSFSLHILRLPEQDLYGHRFSRGRSHEFGANRILNRFAQNPVNLSIIVAGQFPIERLLHCVKLTGVSGTPKSGHSFSPVKNPSDRECKKALPVILPGVL